MKEYCNICGRELLEDVLVVDTSLDMKPIKFKDVQGDKSDLTKSSMCSGRQLRNREAQKLTLKKHVSRINMSAAHVFVKS